MKKLILLAIVLLSIFQVFPIFAQDTTAEPVLTEDPHEYWEAGLFYEDRVLNVWFVVRCLIKDGEVAQCDDLPVNEPACEMVFTLQTRVVDKYEVPLEMCYEDLPIDGTLSVRISNWLTHADDGDEFQTFEGKIERLCSIAAVRRLHGDEAEYLYILDQNGEWGQQGYRNGDAGWDSEYTPEGWCELAA